MTKPRGRRLKTEPGWGRGQRRACRPGWLTWREAARAGREAAETDGRAGPTARAPAAASPDPPSTVPPAPPRPLTSLDHMHRGWKLRRYRCDSGLQRSLLRRERQDKPNLLPATRDANNVARITFSTLRCQRPAVGRTSFTESQPCSLATV